MAIGRSQCCFDPIGLRGEPSQFVLILSLIRSEEPIRISSAGFLEVGYFLILNIMRWWVISRSPRLSFVPSCSCIPCFPSITSSFGLLFLPLTLSEHGVKRTWTIFAHLLWSLKWECHFQAYLRCVLCQKNLKQGSEVWLIKTKRANFKHLTCLAVAHIQKQDRNPQTWCLLLILATTCAIVQTTVMASFSAGLQNLSTVQSFTMFMSLQYPGGCWERSKDQPSRQQFSFNPAARTKTIPKWLKSRKLKNLWTSPFNGQWRVISESGKPPQTKLGLSSVTKHSHWRVWGQGWKVLYTVWGVKTIERTLHTFP